ncbi:MAG: hypothetical protein QM655_12790 [Nocardioidaceae bacterium]
MYAGRAQQRYRDLGAVQGGDRGAVGDVPAAVVPGSLAAQHLGALAVARDRAPHRRVQQRLVDDGDGLGVVLVVLGELDRAAVEGRAHHDAFAGEIGERQQPQPPLVPPR